MGLVETVEAIVKEQMADLADQICADYKSAVQSNLKHPGNSSGQASGSIHVEQMSDTKYRIGSNDLHLYFFEMGNGTSGNPKKPPPRGPMPLTYGTLGKPQGYAMRVSNYAGKNIKAKIAKKYNG